LEVDLIQARSEIVKLPFVREGKSMLTKREKANE